MVRQCSAPRIVVLKPNARVVLLKNLNVTLVNGLCGSIHSFVNGYPCVAFDNGELAVIKEELFHVESDCTIVATRKQIPLDLAYALTIHRSQGMSFRYVEVDLSTVFEAGQAYVAVSRAQTTGGLRIAACKETLPEPCQDVKNFYCNGHSIITASQLNVNRILDSGKKCDKITLPLITIEKCTIVSSTAEEPPLLTVTEQFSLCELPEDAIDRIHRCVQKESVVSHDLSEVLARLKLRKNGTGQMYSESDIQIMTFCH